MLQKYMLIVFVLVAFVVGGTASEAAVSGEAVCAQKKSEAAGKKALDMLKALGLFKRHRSPVRLRGFVSKAQSRFTKRFAKAEASNDCATTDDAGDIGAKVDTFVMDMRDTFADPITEIIDKWGAAARTTLDGPWGVALDAAGNVYVAGGSTDNVFKITPGGVITEIIARYGHGHTVDSPRGSAPDAAGNVYVAGMVSDNVFKITPEGVITEIVDETGDGAGNTLNGPSRVVVDADGNVYVVATYSDNVFKIFAP
jgi:DNA-binding beta-propeller fold protein YncE